MRRGGRKQQNRHESRRGGKVERRQHEIKNQRGDNLGWEADKV